MAELTPRDRQLAIAALDRVEQTLTQMSMWVDDDSADSQRVAIMLEDSAKSVMVASYLLSRADRLRAAELVHRRMSAPDGQAAERRYQN